jgi:hypothetical protein
MKHHVGKSSKPKKELKNLNNLEPNSFDLMLQRLLSKKEVYDEVVNTSPADGKPRKIIVAQLKAMGVFAKNAK